MLRGVAWNLLKGGQTRGSGDGSPSAGSRGRAPVEVWGRSLRKPMWIRKTNKPPIWDS